MEPKTTEWRPGPSVCRCCLTEGCYKDIATEYFWMGKREVYEEMLSETLNVSISYSQSGGPNSNSRLICEPCISRLRDATEFKRQVQECEKTFMQHLDPSSSQEADIQAVALTSFEADVKIERVKLEEKLSDDDFGDRDFHDDDDDDDDDLDNQPLMTLATKIPKKESVDLLDLLDNTKATVKRKSSSKVKGTAAKKTKTVKREAKAGASKSAPKVEKKKKEQNTAAVVRLNSRLLLQYATAYPFKLASESTVVCVYCGAYGKNYDDPVEFRKHMNEEHSDISDVTLIGLPSGRRIKVDCTELACRICSQQIPDLKQIAVHLKTNHADHPDSELDRLELERDFGLMPFKMQKNRLSCATCGVVCSNIRNLNVHSQSHLDKLTCEICGKGLSNRESLTSHIRSHKKGKMCSHCQQAFPSAQARRQHLKESPKCWYHVCNVCGERFIDWNLKQRHLSQVHEVKGFDCSMCGEKFPNMLLFNKHFKARHKQLQCLQCELHFSDDKALMEHTLSHQS